MTSARGYRAVYVAWRDSRTHGSAWMPVGELTTGERDHAMCYSVGFLVSEAGDQYVLAANLAALDADRTDAASGITIPKSAVVEFRRL